MILLIFIVIIAQVITENPTTICDKQRTKCYQVVTNLAGFAKSESYCISLYGQLTSMEDAFENSFLNGLASAYLKEMNLTSFWIGANHFTRNTWSWVDGAEWSYTNWAPGEPLMNTCVSVSTVTGTWMSSRSHEKLASICIVPSPKLPYCTDSTIMNRDTSSCYTSVSGHNTFREAEEACIGLSFPAHLISVHSLEESNFIADSKKTTISQPPEQQVYLGLQYNEDKNWVWTDGSKMNYSNWALNQPNLETGDCAVLYADNDPSLNYPVVGKWASIDCNTRVRSAFCKRPVEYESKMHFEH